MRGLNNERFNEEAALSPTKKYSRVGSSRNAYNDGIQENDQHYQSTVG